jgi:pilus assembly protein Flp/PilA
MDLITGFPGLWLRGCAFFPAKITQKFILNMSIHDESQDSPSLWRDEEGTTAVEYAVMLALIVAVCIGSVATLTEETKKSFEQSGDAIAGAMGN